MGEAVLGECPSPGWLCPAHPWPCDLGSLARSVPGSCEAGPRPWPRSRAQGTRPRVGCRPGARVDQPRRRGWLARRRLACVPPAWGTSPRSRYSRPRMGRSAPTVAAETPAGRLPDRITGPVVVVAAPVVVGPVVVVAGPVEVGAALVVGPVVGAMLVVDTSVVVDATVLVGAVVVGPAVVGGAVTVGWVVAPTVEGAVVGVLLPTVAGAWAVADPVVVVGPLTARRPGFAVVEGGGAVVGSRGWWWWSTRTSGLAVLATSAARRRVRGVAVRAGAAGWPRPPGRPGARW